jgi:chromosome segregation ATPase
MAQATKTATIEELQATLAEVLEEAATLRKQAQDEPLKALHLAGQRQLLEAGAAYLREAIAEVERLEADAAAEANVLRLQGTIERTASHLDALYDDAEAAANKLLELAPEIAEGRKAYADAREQLRAYGADDMPTYSTLANRNRTASGMSDFIVRVKRALERMGA